MNPISPKVSAGLLAGIAVSALLSNISLIDPHMLSWFGPWSPFIYGTGVSVLSGIAAFLVRDPLRDLGAIHAAAGTPHPQDTPVTAPLPVQQGPRHLA